MRPNNQCQFIGNLGKKPEARYTANGNLMLTFSLAINSKKGEPPTWVNCVAFDKLAELIKGMVGKGAKVLVQARYQQRRVETDGEPKYYTSFIVQEFEMLKGGKPDGEKDAGGEDEAGECDPDEDGDYEPNEEMPF